MKNNTLNRLELLHLADFRIRAVGDSAVTVEFGSSIDPQVNAMVHALRSLLGGEHVPGISDMIPTFCSLLICYDTGVLRYDELCRQIRRVSENGLQGAASPSRTFLIPVCLFAPAIISIIGAALFFLVFPDYLDLSGSYLQSSLPEGVNLLDILEQNGLSYGIYVAISFVSSITYAPVINMFLAVGEEVGWRGFLYPELNKSMGKIPTWLLGGLIWGAFHFPVMILAGYEYGTTYWGFPVVGMLVFSLFTVALGLISEVIYDKTKCIWYPSLLHGAVNASNFVMLFFNINKENSDKMTILGPCFNGLVAGVPLLLTAVIVGMVSLKKKKEITEG